MKRHAPMAADNSDSTREESEKRSSDTRTERFIDRNTHTHWRHLSQRSFSMDHSLKPMKHFIVVFRRMHLSSPHHLFVFKNVCPHMQICQNLPPHKFQTLRPLSFSSRCIRTERALLITHGTFSRSTLLDLSLRCIDF